MADAYDYAAFYQWWNQASIDQRKRLLSQGLRDYSRLLTREIDNIAQRNSEQLTSIGGISHTDLEDLVIALGRKD